MPKQSAGVLMYRFRQGNLEVMLVHPGGPFWARKDSGAWSIPKGEYSMDQDALTAARREFFEETGVEVTGSFRELGQIRQAGGKHVMAWAVEGNLDVAELKSNTFKLEWPPGSGKFRDYPEVDQWKWFGVTEARQKILKSQAVFLGRLCALFGIPL